MKSSRLSRIGKAVCQMTPRCIRSVFDEPRIFFAVMTGQIRSLRKKQFVV